MANITVPAAKLRCSKMTRLFRLTVISGMVWCSFSLSVYGQLSNRSVFESLLVECVAPLADSHEAVVLDADENWSFLRPALVNAWLAEGKAVFSENDAAVSPDDDWIRVQFRIEKGSPVYESAGKHQLRRTVSLTEHHLATSQNGRIIADASCTKQYSDTLHRDEVATVESPEFPATVGVVPVTSSFRKKFLEPAVLVASLATTVYLFFSVRSRASGEN